MLFDFRSLTALIFVYLTTTGKCFDNSYAYSHRISQNGSLDFPSNDMSTDIPEVPLSELFLRSRTEEMKSRKYIHSKNERDNFSRMKRLGDSHYLFSNVCLRSLQHGGIHFYHNPSRKASRRLTSVKLCNEHVKCINFRIKLMNEPLPKSETSYEISGGERSSPTWYLSHQATAVVESMTRLTGWHLLHHLISLSQLLEHESERISSPTIHLHPFFYSEDIRLLYNGLNSSHPFNSKSSPFWPLMAAVQQPHHVLKLVNLLEAESALPGVKVDENPMVCYSKLFLGTPQMVTKKGFSSKRYIWGEIEAEHVTNFRNKVLERANSSQICSTYCAGGNGTLKGKLRSPLAVLVLRKGRRFIENEDDVAAVLRSAGFDVLKIYLEQMSILEQIRLARVADLVVGPHGNGLTHVFWMRKGSVMIEFYPTGSPWKLKDKWNKNSLTNYGSLARFAGVNHYAIASMREKHSSRKAWRNKNITVNLEKLEEIMPDVIKFVEIMPCCETSRV